MFPTHILSERTDENTSLIYRVNEEGQIILQTVNLTHTPSAVIGNEYQQDSAQNSTPSGLPDPESKFLRLETETGSEVKDEEIAKMLFEDKPDQLSWTRNRINWRKNLTLERNGLAENVERLINTSDMLKVNDPLMLTPKLEQFKHLFPSPEAADKTVEEIKKILGKSKAFGLVSRVWNTSFNSDIFIPCPPHHVVDIIVISDEGSIYLFTIVTQTLSTLENQFRYIFTLGRLTKNHLLKERNAGHDLCVNCFLFNTDNSTKSNTQLQSTPVMHKSMTTFLQTKNNLTFIRRSLSVMLLSKDTFFKTVLGEDRLYELSADQTRVIFTSTTNKLTLVHGPPGSGKSLIAMHIARRENNKDHVLFVSSTESFRKFIEYQNIATTAVVKTDNELAELFHGRKATAKQVIILDDAQNIGCTESTLQQLLYLVKVRTEWRMYIFVDNDYQCFKDRIQILLSTDFYACCSKVGLKPDIHRLGQVHRNTQKVMSFLATSVAGLTPGRSDLTCMHDWEGDDVEVRTSGNIWTDTRQNNILAEVFKLTEKKPFPLDSRGYIMSDISILLDTDNTDRDIRHLRHIIQNHIPNIKVITACDYPRDGITVDEVDSFYGLDSRVCFYVLSSSRIQGDTGTRSISNPRYRAFLASRAVEKTVFFVPKLDVDVFKTLLFDNPVVGVHIT